MLFWINLIPIHKFYNYLASHKAIGNMKVVIVNLNYYGREGDAAHFKNMIQYKWNFCSRTSDDYWLYASYTHLPPIVPFWLVYTCQDVHR